MFKFIAVVALLVSGCAGNVGDAPESDSSSDCAEFEVCTEAGLHVTCESNGAESLCVCSGTMAGHLTSLACLRAL